MEWWDDPADQEEAKEKRSALRIEGRWADEARQQQKLALKLSGEEIILTLLPSK